MDADPDNDQDNGAKLLNRMLTNINQTSTFVLTQARTSPGEGYAPLSCLPRRKTGCGRTLMRMRTKIAPYL